MVRRCIDRCPLLTFFVLAYALSWSVAIPLALQAQGVVDLGWPGALHYLTAFGPALSGIIVARLLRAPDWLGRDAPAGPPRRAFRWWVVGAAAPLMFFVIAQLTARMAGQQAIAWAALGQVNFLPGLGIGAWLLWFATSGCGEECGWRGFALPRLQRRHSALTSSVLLSIGWAGWHLPAFFYVPSYLALGPSIVPGFVLGILSGAIVLTWLYNSSGGSLLAVILWHASFNFVTGSPNAAGLTAAVTSAGVMAWAAWILWRYTGVTLTSASPRHRSVRASRRERTRVLPGDDLIATPIETITHAVTIARSPRAVWPWLVQMGAGRAGWYSYDWLDNGRQHSAEHIVAALQQIDVGALMPALPGATDGFTVLRVDQGRSLVIGWILPDGTRLMTWAFVLEQVEAGTRLLVRVRGGPEYRFHGLPTWATRIAVRPVHFVMQRKQLLGLARRAEHPA